MQFVIHVFSFMLKLWERLMFRDMQFVIYLIKLKLWERLMSIHAVCNVLVHVIAMGTADVQTRSL